MTVTTRQRLRSRPQPTPDGWVEDIPYHEEGFGESGQAQQQEPIPRTDPHRVDTPDPRDAVITQLQQRLQEMEDRYHGPVPHQPPVPPPRLDPLVRHLEDRIRHLERSVAQPGNQQPSHFTQPEVTQPRRESDPKGHTIQPLFPQAHTPFRHPFTDRLAMAEIPKAFRNALPIEHFAGTSDPDKHLDSFCNEMLFIGAPEAVICRTFPRTLKGEALAWFKTLLPRSIDRWEDLHSAFIKRFTVVSDVPHNQFTLATLRQGKEESLHNFLSRFYKECARIPDLAENVQLVFAVTALLPGSPFAVSLSEEPAVTMEEFRTRSARFIGREIHLDRNPSNPPAPRADRDSHRRGGDRG